MHQMRRLSFCLNSPSHSITQEETIVCWQEVLGEEKKKKRGEKEGGRKTTPFGVNLMRSQVLYWAAQTWAKLIFHRTA